MYKVPDIIAALVAVIAPVSPPVKPGMAQPYSVPAGIIPLVILVGVTVNEAPLQIVADMALMAATGLTVMVRVKSALLQEPATGVMV